MVDRIHTCTAWDMHAENVGLDIQTDNIDDKGLETYPVILKVDKKPFDVSVMINYCPFCGAKIGNVINMPEGSRCNAETYERPDPMLDLCEDQPAPDE